MRTLSTAHHTSSFHTPELRDSLLIRCFTLQSSRFHTSNNFQVLLRLLIHSILQVAGSVCVCVHVDVCACMCVHVCVCMRTHVCTCKSVHIYMAYCKLPKYKLLKTPETHLVTQSNRIYYYFSNLPRVHQD